MPWLLKSLKHSTSRCSSNWFWITSGGIEGQLIVKPNVICKMHPFWQTISSLPLNIPSIYTPKFPSAYKSDALHGDRNALVSFIRPQSCQSLREREKKTATIPSCSPRSVYEEKWAPAFQLFNMTENLQQSNADQNTERAQLSPHGLLRPAHLGPGRPDIQKVENQLLT